MLEFIQQYSSVFLVASVLLVLVAVVLVVLVKQQLKVLEEKITAEQGKDDQLSLLIAQLREFQIERFADASARNDKALGDIKAELMLVLAQSKEALLTQQNKFEEKVTQKFEFNKQEVSTKLSDARYAQQQSLTEFKESLLESLNTIDKNATKLQVELRERLVTELRTTIKDIREELTQTLTNNSDNMLKGIAQLTTSTDERLKEISGQVEQRLNEGFEKTTKTFNDVLKRLALIDDAQKKITELSTNVVSLQQVLADKRSRGAFGEVQLNALVRNVLPESNFALQYKLSNERIADCILFLPDPTGHVVVDAKFPLESYQKMTDFESGESDRSAASRQFKQDIKKHIKDIKEKYIIEGETASGAMMFIPAEAVFAEIHGHFPELVELAHKEKVWLVSPTTMMAILTTASAVIKDEATRKQVHIIQEHLGYLAEDFGRFKTRMDNLSKHIGQVSKDVDQINTSAQKITSRFQKIEKVELPEEEQPGLLE